MLQCAGFNIESEVRYSFIPNGPGHKYPEVHYLLLARKVEDQPLLGPYPSPTKDELLSMHIRHHPVDRFISFELDAFLEVATKEILCLGCINKDGASINSNVHLYDGSAESLPFPSGKFDIVLASSVLESVKDIEVALGEIVRVTRRNPSSRILIFQGAPDNELIRFLNTTPALTKASHQGCLLHFAKEYLAEHEFRKANLSRIGAHYKFPEEKLSERCEAAANILAGDSLSKEDMEELISRLEHVNDALFALFSELEWNSHIGAHQNTERP
ncbi:hypothetical protein MaudCBS49596_007300 [Microsporum audouinii]